MGRPQWRREEERTEREKVRGCTEKGMGGVVVVSVGVIEWWWELREWHD